MEGTHESLCLRAQVPYPGQTARLSRLVCFVQRSLANKLNQPRVPGPFQGDKFWSKEPWGLPPSFLGLVLGPVRGRSSLATGVPDLRSGALPHPSSIPAQASQGRKTDLAVANVVGLVLSISWDAPGEGAWGWATPGQVSGTKPAQGCREQRENPPPHFPLRFL